MDTGIPMTISIAINVNFPDLHALSFILTFTGKKYGHYANEPHCYSCKQPTASYKLLAVSNKVQGDSRDHFMRDCPWNI